MKPAHDPCAGCLSEILGDNWVYMTIPYRHKTDNSRINRDFMRHTVTIHNHDWCKMAAHVKLLRELAETGQLCGHDYLKLKEKDAAWTNDDSALPRSISQELSVRLARRLFPPKSPIQ